MDTIKELFIYLNENQVKIDSEIKNDQYALELWKNIDTLKSNLEFLIPDNELDKLEGF